MKVTMMLADHAEVAEGKLFINGGGWTVTGPGPIPFGIALFIEVPTPKYPDVTVRLVGVDSNAGTIMGEVTRALKTHLRSEGLGGPFIEQTVRDFRREAISGDYDHLLRTCMEWVNVE